MMKYFWMLGALLCSIHSLAQTDSLQAEKYMLRVENCMDEGKTDSAAYWHSLALKLFQKHNLLAPWLRSYADMGYYWADYQKQPFIGTDLIEYGIASMFRKPETVDEWKQLALTYIAAGHIRRSNAGDFVGAKGFYEQGYHIFENKIQSNNDGLARYLYHNLGNIYTRFGDYPRAESLLQKGVAYGRSHPYLGMADQSDLAIVFIETQQYEAALNTLNEGLGLPQSTPEVVVTMLQNKAITLHKLGRSNDALRTIQRVPALIRQLTPYDDSLYYAMENHITEAEILVGLKKEAAAESLYKKAIQEGIQNWETSQRREIAKVHGALGVLHFSQQKYTTALNDFHHALQCVLKDFKSENAMALPKASEMYSENTIIEALEGKARCFLALGQLEKALECYELIPVANAELIATHAYESSSLLTLEEGRARFNSAIAIAWQLFEKTGNRNFADRAFALTEQARAVLLLQSIAKARTDFNLPPDVRKQEQDLQIKTAWYEQQIAETEKLKDATAITRLEKLKKELFDLKQDQQHFQDQLREQFPDYANLSDQIQFLSSQSVSKLLLKGQALFDYYLTDTDVYIFYFNKKDAFSARKVALPPLFRDQLLRFFNFMSTKNEDPQEKEWYLRMSHELYALLMQPELEADKNTPESLMIIPDDALVFIPFDVLLQQTADAKAKWRNLPFLLKNFSTGYAYSATLWDMQQKISQDHRNKPAPKYNFAGFAPSYDESAAPNDSTRGVTIPKALIYNIKSTQKELDKVHALMGGVKFPQGQTSEAQFKQIAPDCGILLLAMHGLANDEHPELSCLLFGMPKGDSINNDVLYANELQIMRLQADLSVLSACHTGFGKLHKGEGVYSLARAFAMAGVPSTVMSIWRLHENTAPILTEAFFKYLKAGYTKDKALQLAKKDFLANDDNYDDSHPFYWAGVTVNGDMCPLGSSTKWYWLLGALVVLVVVGWWFFRRRK